MNGTDAIVANGRFRLGSATSHNPGGHCYGTTPNPIYYIIRIDEDESIRALQAVFMGRFTHLEPWVF